MKLPLKGLLLVGLLALTFTVFHSSLAKAANNDGAVDQNKGNGDLDSLDDTATSEWKHKETPKPKTKDSNAKKDKKKKPKAE